MKIVAITKTILAACLRQSHE